MTSLPPVRFSFGDADHVADELQATATAVEQVLGQFTADLPLVREDWRGRFRDTFELEVLRTRLGLSVLADSMRQAAHEVRTGALEAAAENRRRARLREED